MAERKELIRRIGEAGFRGMDRGETKLDFHFESTPGLRGSLEELIALESECCPFLEFGLSEGDDSLTLTVEAPEDAAMSLDAIRDMLATPL